MKLLNVPRPEWQFEEEVLYPDAEEGIAVHEVKLLIGDSVYPL